MARVLGHWITCSLLLLGANGNYDSVKWPTFNILDQTQTINLKEAASEKVLWHSNVLGAGAWNRYELMVTKLEEEFALDSGDVKKWFVFEQKSGVKMVGLGENYLLLQSASFGMGSFGGLKIVKLITKNHPTAVALFKMWNDTSDRMEDIACVSYTDTNQHSLLVWYKLTDNRWEEVWSWEYQKLVKDLQFFYLKNVAKLLLTSESPGNQFDSVIYTFELNGQHNIWYSSKMEMNGSSKVVTSLVEDRVYFVVPVPQQRTLLLYSYTDAEKVELHQRLEIDELTSSSIAFSIGLDSYYTISTNNKSAIYKLDRGSSTLVLVHDNLERVVNWLQIPVNDYRGDVIVLGQTEQNEVLALTWTGDRGFKMQTKFGCSGSNLRSESMCTRSPPGLRLDQAVSITLGKTHGFLVPDQGGKTVLFKISFTLEPVLSKIEKQLIELEQRRKEIELQVESQRQEIRKLKTLKETWPRPADTQSNRKIQRIEAEKVVLLDEATNIANMEFGGNQRWTKSDTAVNVENLFDNFNQTRTMSRNMERKLRRLGVDSVSDSLSKNVVDGLLVSGKIVTDNLHVDKLNGRSVDDIFEDTVTVYNSNRRRIKGTKTFDNLDVNAVHFESINSIPADQLLYSDTKDEEMVINGDVVFEDFVRAEDLNVVDGGTVAGLNMKKDVVQTNKFYEGTLKLGSVAIENDTKVEGTINDLPMILPMKSLPDLKTMTNVQNARIESIHVNRDLDVRFINGLDINDVFSGVIWKNKEMYFSGQIWIDGVLNASNLWVDTTNGRQFPSSYVKTDDPEVNINGVKLMKGAVVVGNLSVGTVNGKRPEHWVTLSTQQTLDHELTFEQLSVTNNFTYNTAVDSSEDSGNVPTTHVFKNLRINGELSVGYLNRDKFDELALQVVYKDMSPITINSSKHFSSDIIVDRNIKVNTINDIKPSDILTLDTEQTIDHPVYMSDAVVIESLQSKDGMLDYVNVDELDRSIVKLSTDEVVDADLVFQNGLEVKQFSILGKLNREFDEDTVFFRGDVFNVNKDVMVEALNVEELRVFGSVDSNNKINEHDLNYIQNNRLSRTKPQVIKAIIPTKSRVIGNITVNKFNDVLLPHKLQLEPTNLVDKFLQNKLQRLNKLVVKGNIKTDQGINDQNLQDMFQHAISLNKTSQITGDVRFKGDVTFNQLQVEGLINNVDIADLKRDVVFKNEKNLVLKGSKKFVNDINVNNVVTKYLNGQEISKIFTKNGNQNVTGSFTINGNVRIKSGVPFMTNFNNMSLSSIYGHYMTDKNMFIIAGDLNLKQQFSINNLLTKGLIGGDNFNEFVNDLIFTNEDVVINAPKKFVNTIRFEEDLKVKNDLNGLKLDDLFNDMMFIDKPGTFYEKVTLKSARIENMTIDGDLEVASLNNCDVNEWVEDSVPLNTFIMVKGRKIFDDFVSKNSIHANFINNKTVSTLIRLDGDQNIPNQLRFKHVRTGADVVVDGTVNGKVLRDKYLDTLMTHGDQEITGSKVFARELTVKGYVEMDTISGKQVDDIVTTDTDQEIDTMVKFTDTVTMNDVAVNYVNDVVFNDWSSQVVTLDTAQTITEPWTVYGDVVVKGRIDGYGTVNSVNLRDLMSSAETKKKIADEMEDDIRDEFVGQCMDVQELSVRASKQPFIFKQFEPMQGLDYGKDIETVMHFKASGEDYLVISLKNECLSALLKWETNRTEYVLQKFVNFGTITKWATITRQDETYLIISSSQMCEDDSDYGNVWIFGTNIYQHASTERKFKDILVPKSDGTVFYTLGEDGNVLEWVIGDGRLHRSKLLYTVEGDNYRFVPYELGYNLSVTDGRTVMKISTDKNENSVARLSTEILPGRKDGEIATGILRDKTLAVVTRSSPTPNTKTLIKIYDDIKQESLLDTIAVLNPSSLTWLELSNNQHYLLYLVNNRLIQAHPYRGINRFQQDVLSIYIPYCDSISTVELPTRNYFLPRKYLLLVSKSILYVVEAEMSGNPYGPIEDIQCTLD